ncbi:hypothetical protein C1637_11990 [Chryseobacterium lactis]|uniref:GLPGLI family protein n=1 Tax=Chryseobacterium lactis TaxID=1241981 RepID=A0A3G6RV46_CHRLC|nr:hypothetical protein [Chryseobacterium lactis]AZA80752.1 hypothetical protein EG342_01950 [Chryseobacterium lactis]AZB05754.1 hypothetical protein EG341_18075 [Chryseobacterium lactis]PNW13527.1 hypothetical protein C1637_11990 [Chryseobacterium lactis]
MKLYIFICIFLIFNIAAGQKKEYPSIKKGDFPEGIYMTLQDVLNKVPSSTEEVYFKACEKCDSINLPEKTFFYFKQKDKKVKIPLAVSHKGELYFQTYRKYTNRDDRGYDPDQYSRFCKVINYGRFIYFEENMRGTWSKAFLGAVSPLTYSINGRTKGIVLDVENKEFNILQNCDDLNDFLFEHEIPSIKCDPEKFNIGDLRKEIDKINTPYR